MSILRWVHYLLTYLVRLLHLRYIPMSRCIRIAFCIEYNIWISFIFYFILFIISVFWSLGGKWFLNWYFNFCFKISKLSCGTDTDHWNNCSSGFSSSTKQSAQVSLCVKFWENFFQSHHTIVSNRKVSKKINRKGETSSPSNAESVD